MARTELSDNLAKAGDFGRYSDTVVKGLSLKIDKYGARYSVRYTHEGKRRDVAVGPARGKDAINVDLARVRAEQIKGDVGSASAVELHRIDGRNIAAPAAPRKPRPITPTVYEAADSVAAHKQKTGKWKQGGKHQGEWTRLFARYATAIGSKGVGDVRATDIAATLREAGARRTETVMGRERVCGGPVIQRKLHTALKAVFEWAVEFGHAKDNPAAGSFEYTAPRAPHKTINRVAVPTDQVGERVAAMLASRAYPATRLAFALTVLTAVRISAALKAEWREVDFEAGVWQIPGAHMKGRNAPDHFVPLSRQALAILREARALTNGVYVFPSQTGEPMRATVVQRYLTEAGIHRKVACADGAERNETVHGYRSAFNEFAVREGYPKSLWDRALAHGRDDKVEAAYNRAALTEERRPLMQAWADHVMP